MHKMRCVVDRSDFVLDAVRGAAVARHAVNNAAAERDKHAKDLVSEHELGE